MKEQVTSIEQSMRLIEMGIPVEKDSMVWFPEYKIGLFRSIKICQ
nr:MAG TPA_asm: hypothetical protein [Caudoviricetes sp.]